jgi:hypothetical protein
MPLHCLETSCTGPMEKPRKSTCVTRQMVRENIYVILVVNHMKVLNIVGRIQAITKYITA